MVMSEVASPAAGPLFAGSSIVVPHLDAITADLPDGDAAHPDPSWPPHGTTEKQVASAS